MHARLKNIRSMRNARGQKGFSLIEMAIVLAIAGAVLFGVLHVIGVVQGKRKTNNEAQNLLLMANDLRTKFSGQNSFTGINAANMIKLGIVPQTMISGTTISSGFSTPVTVVAASLNGVMGDAFEFQYQVPASNCSDFVMATESGFSKVTLGGTVIKNIAQNVGDNAITVDELALCNSSGTGNAQVAVLFTQGR